IYCFFFSSRRRHTRFSRDWSSDVCSSDLLVHLIRNFGDDDRVLVALLARLDGGPRAHQNRAAPRRVCLDNAALADNVAGGRKIRSEERRVGKGGGDGWRGGD